MKQRSEKEKGFTLLELLVTMTMVSILGAIALPQYHSHKARGFNARAVSDLRDAMTAEEYIYVDKTSYIDCVDAGCEAVLPNYVRSEGTTITIETRSSGQTYRVTVTHPSGDEAYQYDSENGGIVVL